MFSYTLPRYLAQVEWIAENPNGTEGQFSHHWIENSLELTKVSSLPVVCQYVQIWFLKAI
jgi:hypothetical protein